MQTFEQWWNEIEGYGLRAERFTTPGGAAKAAWDQAMSLRAQADARPVAWSEHDITVFATTFGADPKELVRAVLRQVATTQPEASAPGLSEREIADTVNKVRDIALQFHATQQLRGRIARVLVPILTRASAATVGEASNTVLANLVNAVRWWGSQEDGIPAEVAPAFNAAHLALGWSLSHPTDFKAAAQQSKQNSAHEWDASGERCLKCGDKDWFADSTCSGKASQSGQQAGVEEIAKLREAVDDAAYEWAQYVDVDRAPRTLQKHMLDAFDAATPTQQREGGK